jgi:hypothetical protein
MEVQDAIKAMNDLIKRVKDKANKNHKTVDTDNSYIIGLQVGLTYLEMVKKDELTPSQIQELQRSFKDQYVEKKVAQEILNRAVFDATKKSNEIFHMALSNLNKNK